MQKNNTKPKQDVVVDGKTEPKRRPYSRPSVTYMAVHAAVRTRAGSAVEGDGRPFKGTG